MVVLLLAVSACEVTQTEPEGPPPPVCAAGQIDGEVILLSRPDQISPEVIDQFERRYGVDVVERLYEDEDDLLSRVTAGADDFDVVLLADYLAENLRRGSGCSRSIRSLYQDGSISTRCSADPSMTPSRSTPFRWCGARWVSD